MSILNRLKQTFGKLAKLTRATLDDGTTIIEYVSETLEVGDTVDVVDADGNNSLLADGSYKTQDGLSFTITDGVVSEVTQPEPAAPSTTDTPEETPVAQSKSAALKSFIQKFATGTPEERISNLELMVAALMEYAFGWKIKEKDRDSTENEAIDTYIATIKDATDTAVQPVNDQVSVLKKAVVKQNAQIAQLSKIIEVLAGQPADGKTFGAVGFGKQPEETSQSEDKKHDAVSALSTALAANKAKL